MSSKEYFEKVAEEWDEMRREFFSEEVREKAYELAEIEEDKIAADIGAGTGFITEGLLKRGVRVIVVDQSQEMLDQIRKNFDDPDKLTYKIGDAESLPIEDNEVDHVFANMLLHHVEEPKNAIKEMTRILRPGGKLVITDLDKHDHEFLRTEQKDRWLGFEREDIRRWFTHAGLKDVRVESVGTECCSSSTCDDQEAEISIFAVVGEAE